MDRNRIADIIKNAVVFSKLREEPLIQALTGLLKTPQEETDRAFALCCDLARCLYPHGECLTDRVFELLCLDDNFYIKSVARGEKPPESVEKQAAAELEAFTQAASFSSEYMGRLFKLSSPIPRWTASEENLTEKYAARAGKTGWGAFAAHHVFTLTEEGRLAPVRNPDPQRLSELYGYRRERETVLANVLALLEGLPANNVLLYGDAGTGKSSTVKAAANEFACRGLRLIQAEKALLRHIPALLDRLAENPLKFMIFIDDLSFENDDRDFTALKTVLEGSVAARAGNTIICATSNRRHLVRESFEARRGDEVHLRDTLEEASSLAARFGLVVTFVRPDREEYRNLVLSLAGEYGLEKSEELITQAEAYALRCGGRSPRAAKQFVEFKIGAARCAKA